MQKPCCCSNSAELELARCDNKQISQLVQIVNSTANSVWSVYFKGTCSGSHINFHICIAETCVSGVHMLVVKFNTIVIWSQISVLWFCSIVCHFQQLWTFIRVSHSQDHVMTLIQREPHCWAQLWDRAKVT